MKDTSQYFDLETRYGPTIMIGSSILEDHKFLGILKPVLNLNYRYLFQVSEELFSTNE